MRTRPTLGSISRGIRQTSASFASSSSPTIAVRVPAGISAETPASSGRPSGPLDRDVLEGDRPAHRGQELGPGRHEQLGPAVEVLEDRRRRPAARRWAWRDSSQRATVRSRPIKQATSISAAAERDRGRFALQHHAAQQPERHGRSPIPTSSTVSAGSTPSDRSRGCRPAGTRPGARRTAALSTSSMPKTRTVRTSPRSSWSRTTAWPASRVASSASAGRARTSGRATSPTSVNSESRKIVSGNDSSRASSSRPSATSRARRRSPGRASRPRGCR